MFSQKFREEKEEGVEIGETKKVTGNNFDGVFGKHVNIGV